MLPVHKNGTGNKEIYCKALYLCFLALVLPEVEGVGTAIFIVGGLLALLGIASS
jgi:hypothetical protein